MLQLGLGLCSLPVLAGGVGAGVTPIRIEQTVGVQIVARAFAPIEITQTASDQNIARAFDPIAVAQAAAVAIIAEEDEEADPPTFVAAYTAFNTSGTTRTPTIAAGAVAGDTWVVQKLSRVAGTNTITDPAGEGWAAPTPDLEEASVTSAISVKRVGDGGQVDDTTPTFTNETGGTWGVIVYVFRGAKTTGATYSQCSTWASIAAAPTLTSPVAPSAVDVPTITFWGFQSFDDNALNANTRGTAAISGAGGNVGSTGAMAGVYEQSVDSNANTCTVTESTNGNDAGRAVTLVLSAE